jgi:hypothetical protein
MTEANARKIANDYHKQAADCRKLSERASDQSHRENWLKIAGQWEHLAEIADRNTRQNAEGSP